MPEFWYANGSVMVVYAWLTEDMALVVRVNERHEKVTPMLVSRTFLAVYYEHREEEPWWFASKHNYRAWVAVECA
jgi:hypothetical protein